MNQFSEDNLVEQTVIKLIREVWADSACHINAFTDDEDAKLGRGHRDKAPSLQRRGLGEVDNDRVL